MKHRFYLPIAFLLFCGCTPQIQPIEFGVDQCEHCRMTIADQRYGAELVTKKGKVLKYDAVECLINSLYKDSIVSEEDILSLWVIDFSQNEKLVSAETCRYFVSLNLPSPMGMFITAVEDGQELEKLQHLHTDGETLDWNAVKERVLKKR